MRTRKLLAPVAAGLVAVSMTACGSNSSKTTTNTSSLSSTASSYNQQDPSSLKQGGNLNLAIGSLADNWNPMNTLGNQRDFTDVREPLSARFFDFDDKGQATVDHTWLDDASATTTNGQTVATFKLNPKAAWNDGTKMGLADFVATWKACDGSNTKFNWPPPRATTRSRRSSRVPTRTPSSSPTRRPTPTGRPTFPAGRHEPPR